MVLLFPFLFADKEVLMIELSLFLVKSSLTYRLILLWLNFLSILKAELNLYSFWWFLYISLIVIELFVINDYSAAL